MDLAVYAESLAIHTQRLIGQSVAHHPDFITIRMNVNTNHCKDVRLNDYLLFCSTACVMWAIRRIASDPGR